MNINNPTNSLVFAVDAYETPSAVMQWLTVSNTGNTSSNSNSSSSTIDGSCIVCSSSDSQLRKIDGDEPLVSQLSQCFGKPFGVRVYMYVQLTVFRVAMCVPIVTLSSCDGRNR
jgi:hypothetical protein